MLRALHALPRHRRAGDRRQLRPRRLPDGDAARRARGRPRARVRRRLPACSSCRRSSVALNGDTYDRRQRRRRRERHARPHGRARAGRSAARISACSRATALICATPSGSTAYNLSNGGPVLVWGLDAMVVTFVAPHSLHARPLVVGRDADLVVTNRSPDIDAVVLVDGHPVGELSPGAKARDAPRRRAEPARDAARADVLPPLRQRLRHGLTQRSPARVLAGRAGVAHCPFRTVVAVGSPPYDWSGAAPAPHREPRPDPRGRARASTPGLNAITGETGAGKTILSSAIGLLLGVARRRGRDRGGRRRGVRRGRVRPARRRRARRARRAAARGRGGARPRAADLRRRPDARLRLGAQRGARGRRGRGRERCSR